MAWTDEIVEQLKQHWIDGKSASQIAGLLGNGVTRNAVIGKVHRLGLAGRAKTPGAAALRPPRRAAPPHMPRVAGPRLSHAPRMTRGATALAFAPHALPELEQQHEFESVVVPMSLRVTIIELKEFDVPLAAWRPGDFRIPLLRITDCLRALLRLPWRARLPAGPGAPARSRPRPSVSAALSGPAASRLAPMKPAKKTAASREAAAQPEPSGADHDDGEDEVPRAGPSPQLQEDDGRQVEAIGVGVGQDSAAIEGILAAGVESGFRGSGCRSIIFPAVAQHHSCTSQS